MAYTLKKTEHISFSRSFHVGIYARLSVDSTKQKNESIDTQIAIAKQYIKDHPEMKLYDCYVDLGKTGTNFQREGFERMMWDIRKKYIDCVIVKDLSRFGRNHIETGNYIQNIFPFMGVRFIAITDGIDTFETELGIDELTVNLKNLVNEMYVKDISEKMRSIKRIRKEQGSYTGGVPPYGYFTEWTNGKKCLFICPKTSEIVKEIYKMFLCEKNMHQIVRVLYKRQINRPSIYRNTGYVYRQKGEILEQWTVGTVKFILTNPIYVGYLSLNSKDYSIRQKNHESIISEEVFFQVASIFEKSSVKYCKKSDFSKKMLIDYDIYAGILFCGNCGKRMVRVANIKQLRSEDTVCYYGYCCPSSYRIDHFHCPVKNISMNVLDKLIKIALYQEFALSDMHLDEFVKEYEKHIEERRKQIIQKIIICERRQRNRKIQGSELYLKYHTGNLSLEEFQQMKKENEKSIQEISRSKEELQCNFNKMEQEIKENKELIQNLIQCNKKIKLTKDVIYALINRIDVYAEQRIKITFAFNMNDLLWKGTRKNEKTKKI